MPNAYDERYEFRLATVDDIESIMTFIDTHWRRGHIMATNRAFFEYEFLEANGTVNFVLAIDREKGTIECLNGFLKASHDKKCMDVWGSIWKVLDGNMGMLGIELIRRRGELAGCRYDLDVGNNPKTAVPLLKKLLKRYSVKLDHYFILGERDHFEIARIDHREACEISHAPYGVVRFTSADEVRQRFNFDRYKESVPYKDAWYIEHRFFEHPIYRYEVYGIEKDGVVDALFVLRRQFLGDKCVIRLVDYIGEHERLSGIGDFLSGLLLDERCEYVDMYCHGISEDFISAAGFTRLAQDDSNIIPNYFEPFVRENIDIWADSASEHSVFMKADADQDRPNFSGKDK